MRKFEIGATALCAIVGWYFGSLVGAVVLAVAFVMLVGLVDGLLENLENDATLAKEEEER